MANNIFIDFLPPWVETGIQPAFYDKESGTVLQQTARMYDKVNELVESVNHQNETIDDYIEQFNELHDYVHDYFDNLNVQQEINNKLDNMAMDGSLTQLIGAYVDPIQTAFENEVNETLDTRFSEQNVRIGEVEAMVASAVEGTPLPATSTADMTDTNRIYVNTTDGNWYYYDGDSWEIGGAYEASVLSDGSVDINNLVSNLSKQINQIVIADADIDEYFEGGYINHNTVGQAKINNASSYSVYGPFDLHKGDIVSFTAQAESTVSTLAIANGTNPSNVEIFSSVEHGVDNTVRNYAFQLSYTGEFYISSKNATGVTNFKIYRLNKSFVNDDTTNVTDYVSNIIIDNSDPTNFTRGGYVRYSNGNIVQGTALYYTDYIEINDNTKITLLSDIPSWQMGTQTPDISGYAFYDSSKGYISGIEKPVLTQKLEMTVPNGAKYIRLTLTNGQIINGFKLYYSDLAGDIEKLKNKVIEATETKLNMTTGLTNKAVFIGDSLTYGQCYTASNSSYRNYYNYPYFLKKLMQIDSITELAKSGATSSTWWTQFGDQITDTNTIYFVWLGTNDNFTDTIDSDCIGDDYTQYANTETGNMGKILQKINSLSGNKIILMNVMHNSTNVTQTNQMIAKFAQRFDVALLVDLDASDGRNLKYHKAYNGWVNSVHFNDKGNSYIANYINEALNDYIINNQFEMIKTHA